MPLDLPASVASGVLTRRPLLLAYSLAAGSRTFPNLRRYPEQVRARRPVPTRHPNRRSALANRVRRTSHGRPVREALLRGFASNVAILGGLLIAAA